MQIVIDIAEESYNEIKKNVADRNDHYFLENVIANGTPLPEGHWINNHTQCSNCEWGMEDAVVGSPMRVVFPFCPNCGAKMKND